MRITVSGSVLLALLMASRCPEDLFCEARRSGGGGGSGARIPSRRSSGSGGSGRRSSGGTSTSSSSRWKHDEYDFEDGDEEDEDMLDFGNFPGDDENGNGSVDGEGYYDEDMDGDGYDDMEEDVEEFPLDYDEEDDFGRSQRSGRSRGSSRDSSRNSSRSSSRKGGTKPTSISSSTRSSSRYGSRRPPSSRASSSRTSRSSMRSSSSRSSGRVVPYTRTRAPAPNAFTRGLSALRESMPDPTTLKESALSSISAAKETTTKLSANIYREVKGLTSSELEQVMLKATKPDDSPVKGKHVERLVGVTYQISGRYDIYDAVLRKLWSKMSEKDWRTTIKALYILHRFSADGAPDHQAALKARLRELRRTRDPKRKDKYFNSKQLLAGDDSPQNKHYRAFLARYAHYVLLRAQCFGGMFSEIAKDPNAELQSKSSRSSSQQRQPSSKSNSSNSNKPITSTSLKQEHLDAAQMLLKAGLACSLKESEECEHTAYALERVVSDMIGLTTAVATALNRALKPERIDYDPKLIQQWCQFYSQDLLPQTKGMVKKTATKLDAYGLFLPSRMGATVSQDLIQKGLTEIDGDAATSTKKDDSLDSNSDRDTADTPTNTKTLPVREDVDATQKRDAEVLSTVNKQNDYDDAPPLGKENSEQNGDEQLEQGDDDEYDLYDLYDYEYDEEEEE